MAWMWAGINCRRPTEEVEFDTDGGHLWVIVVLRCGSEEYVKFVTIVGEVSVHESAQGIDISLTVKFCASTSETRWARRAGPWGGIVSVLERRFEGFEIPDPEDGICGHSEEPLPSVDLIDVGIGVVWESVFVYRAEETWGGET